MKARSNTYAALYLDPRWQKKRLAILERDEWACQSCFATENTLHVHHRSYLKGHKPWDYPDRLLVTLCDQCHKEETDQRSEVDAMLVAAFRWHFLGSEIEAIANDLGLLEKLPHTSDVTASALGRAIRNEATFRSIVDDYLGSLRG